VANLMSQIEVKDNEIAAHLATIG